LTRKVVGQTERNTGRPKRQKKELKAPEIRNQSHENKKKAAQPIAGK
jgi:hypothetical protein